MKFVYCLKISLKIPTEEITTKLNHYLKNLLFWGKSCIFCKLWDSTYFTFLIRFNHKIMSEINKILVWIMKFFFFRFVDLSNIVSTKFVVACCIKWILWTLKNSCFDKFMFLWLTNSCGCVWQIHVFVIDKFLSFYLTNTCVYDWQIHVFLFDKFMCLCFDTFMCLWLTHSCVCVWQIHVFAIDKFMCFNSDWHFGIKKILVM